MQGAAHTLHANAAWHMTCRVTRALGREQSEASRPAGLALLLALQEELNGLVDDGSLETHDSAGAVR